MAAKYVALLTITVLAIVLLVSSTQSGARASGKHSIELARGKNEIHLVGFGKLTAQGKMSAEIITQAFKKLSNGKETAKVQISWVEDRQLLLNPLLSRKVFDFGFSWEKPDCNGNPQNALCNRYFFSKPVYTVAPTDGGADVRRTFYAIIAKSHPRARTYLYYLNSALDHLRTAGEYEAIVARYGRRFASQ